MRANSFPTTFRIGSGNIERNTQKALRETAVKRFMERPQRQSRNRAEQKHLTVFLPRNQPMPSKAMDEKQSGKPGLQPIGDLLAQALSSLRPTVSANPKPSESASDSAITGLERANVVLIGTRVSEPGLETRSSSVVAVQARQSLTLPSNSSEIGPQFLPQWLQKFRYGDDLPAGVRASDLSGLLDVAQQRLLPSDAKQFAQAIDRLFTFARTFGTRDFDAQAVAKFYREALADMPALALAGAVDAAIKTWKWQTIPKPADLRELGEPVSSKLLAVQSRIMVAQMALRHRGAA